MKEYEIEITGMKYFYLLTVCTSVYNIIVTTTLYSNKGKSRLENTIFTIIADWTSLLLVTIFFIILPKQKCFFTGISYIPMILISLIETELNVTPYRLARWIDDTLDSGSILHSSRQMSTETFRKQCRYRAQWWQNEPLG